MVAVSPLLPMLIWAKYFKISSSVHKMVCVCVCACVWRGVCVWRGMCVSVVSFNQITASPN